MDPSHYRFYQQTLPSVNDFVMVKVRNVTSLGIYVDLIEYAGAEGMIVTSEISKRRIRSVHQHVKGGQILCCLVIRVDKEKGYIDLSKRRVTSEDAKSHLAKYSKAKTVHSIITRSAHLLGYSSAAQVYDFYSRTAWYVNGSSSRKTRAKSCRVFWQALEDPSILHNFPIEDDARAVLESTIRTHLHHDTTLIKACISVTCIGLEGVDAVKESLKNGLKLATSDIQLKIRYLNSPIYSMTVETEYRNTKKALDTMKSAISAVEEQIKSYDGGHFSLVKKPTISSKLGDNKEGDENIDVDEETGDADVSDTDCSSGSQPEDDDVDDSRDKEEDDGSKMATMAGIQSQSCAIMHSGEDSGIGKDDECIL